LCQKRISLSVSLEGCRKRTELHISSRYPCQRNWPSLSKSEKTTWTGMISLGSNGQGGPHSRMLLNTILPRADSPGSAPGSGIEDWLDRCWIYQAST
jgi:hypothetical protein